MAEHRILVTDPLHADGLELLRAAPGTEVLEIPFAEADRWRAELPTCDAWIVRSGSKVREADLDLGRSLKVVARAGVGVDNVDVTAATRRGVVVMNAPDANSVTTAELAIAHLLGLARNLARADRLLREGGWSRKDLVGQEVEGKVLGVLGLGRIGRKVAAKGAGLGLVVIGHDPQVTPQSAADFGVEWVSFDEILARSDFLSLHVPLTERTRHLLDDAAFARAKPGLRLVQCARGGLVDEAALIRALDSGRVLGAALDVFEQEPPPADHPLRSDDRVVLSPHLGASTQEATRRVSLEIAEQVLEHLRGERTRNAVNLPSLDAPTLERLGPSLDLARRCGRFLAQWRRPAAGAAEPIERVVAEFRGDVADEPVELLRSAFLVGLLESDLGGSVNPVNAAFLARERGIEVEERRTRSPRDFSSLLRFEVASAGATHEVAGALFGRRMPRLVVVDGLRTEVVPEGRLLALRHFDRPGVVGRIGSLLGDAGVNIGSMHVSNSNRDGRCITVLEVSAALGETLLRALRALPEIELVHCVELP